MQGQNVSTPLQRIGEQEEQQQQQQQEKKPSQPSGNRTNNQISLWGREAAHNTTAQHKAKWQWVLSTKQLASGRREG